MKKLLFIIVSVSFVSLSTQAQYFSIGVQTGFGIGIPDVTYGQYSTLRYSSAWGYIVDELQGVNKSLGQGVPIDLEFGYSGSTGIAFGLTVGYQHGLNHKTEYGIQYYADKDERSVTYQGRYFHASPYLGLYKRWNKWGFSVRLYPVFAFPSFSTTTNVQLPDNSNGTDGDRFYFLRKYKGPLTVGFKGSFDFEHLINDGKQAVFFGVSYTHLSFSPNSSELTEYEVNGHDKLSQLTTNERYSEYSNNQEVRYNFNPDGSINWNQLPDQPRKAYKFDVPFNNFAFNIGFRLYFNRNKSVSKDEKPPL